MDKALTDGYKAFYRDLAARDVTPVEDRKNLLLALEKERGREGKLDYSYSLTLYVDTCYHSYLTLTISILDGDVLMT